MSPFTKSTFLSAQFLTKHGHDVRRGDAVAMTLTVTTVVVKPKHHLGVPPMTFHSVHITACHVVRTLAASFILSVSSSLSCHFLL